MWLHLIWGMNFNEGKYVKTSAAMILYPADLHSPQDNTKEGPWYKLIGL